jgi:hypothetical protein
MMTQQEALEIAVRMHQQRIPYPKIAEHLKAAGYISARTKAPIGALAVRHMVTMLEKKKVDSAREDAKEDTISLAAPKADLIKDIGIIMSNADISFATKTRILSVLTKEVSA